METILDHIDAALRAKGLKDATASRLAAGNPSLIKNIRSGGGNVGFESLQKLAAVLDLEIYFGPKRTQPRPVELRMISNHDPDQDAPTGFLTIPWHDGKPGSGSAPVAFSRAWLDRHQLVPDFLQAVIPDRFAISPAPDADTVTVLDTRLAARDGVGLWCYRDAGRVTVSYMTFRGDLSVIHPATPEAEARAFKDTSALTLGLIGKVVWMGQLVPLKGKVR